MPILQSLKRVVSKNVRYVQDVRTCQTVSITPTSTTPTFLGFTSSAVIIEHVQGVVQHTGRGILGREMLTGTGMQRLPTVCQPQSS